MRKALKLKNNITSTQPWQQETDPGFAPQCQLQIYPDLLSFSAVKEKQILWAPCRNFLSEASDIRTHLDWNWKRCSPTPTAFCYVTATLVSYQCLLCLRSRTTYERLVKNTTAIINSKYHLLLFRLMQILKYLYPLSLKKTYYSKVTGTNHAPIIIILQKNFPHEVWLKPKLLSDVRLICYLSLGNGFICL